MEVIEEGSAKHFKRRMKVCHGGRKNNWTTSEKHLRCKITKLIICKLEKDQEVESERPHKVAR